MKQTFILSTIIVIALFSCKKKDVTYDPNVKAAIAVQFDNVVGNSDLQLNTGSHTNAAGESFKVSLMKYFVSNFKFKKSDGTIYTVPQEDCYFLTDESIPASLKPALQIPEGEYTQVSFVLGVDSLRNTMDVSKRTGNLDVAGVAAGMYWSWNSGYIFFKLEGNSPASTQTDNFFKYHIGLFGGYSTPTLNNLKTITIDLTAKGILKAKSGKNPVIRLKTDALKMFNGSSNVSIAANPVVMAVPYSATVANNYANMFSHDATIN